MTSCSEDGDADDEIDTCSSRPSLACGNFKPAMTLKQRRRQRLSAKCDSAAYGGGGRLQRCDSGYGASINEDPLSRADANEAEVQVKASPASSSSTSSANRWLNALSRIKKIADPWQKYKIEEYPTEICKRHRYHALRQKWVVDTVSVKIQTESFNHGAMRTCFRLKKLSGFAKSVNWKGAHNYVAKSYIESVDKQVYFEDVKLQMDAKLWGEEFDRHNPPKKVDIFQMSILEFVDRPNAPLFHLEHFIEGEYIKYNSNSGFVDETFRQTPQAFSHFTFEQSGHRLLVVDIQGVGDLWTDPQIHTCDGLGYGDGNLGTRGMALFFQTHHCNEICRSLGLSPFDLTQTESDHITSPFNTISSKVKSTIVRGNELCLSPTSEFHERPLVSNICTTRRQREISLSSMSELSEECSESDSETMFQMDDDSGKLSKSMPPVSFMNSGSERITGRGQRNRSQSGHTSESSDKSVEYYQGSSLSDKLSMDDEERSQFQTNAAVLSRPSCVHHEIDLIRLEKSFKHGSGISILGQIHHDLSKYHELGRFSTETTTEEHTREAAIYHEKQAADLGVKEAIVTMARMSLGLQRDILVNYTLPDTETVRNEGINYMLLAAEAGDRQAMLFMAEAYETSINLGTSSDGQDRKRSYAEAVKWYSKAVNTTSDDISGEYDATMDHPVYELEAKLARLYHHGGFDLDADPATSGDYYTSAADNAMAMMKGRLANKYYALAEEAYALVDDD